MNSFFKKHHHTVFYASWLVLGLIQSLFTELQDDEAYYWVFSKFLDWGYFDHPPMIALLIKMGATLLPGALGVRLFPVLLSTATIYLTEKLTLQKSPFLFYAIALSVAVLQISGFIAVPDVPLLFFTALFFIVYRNYLQAATWRNALLVGLVAACLLYSKYHGLLVLAFILAANIKLLRDVKIYAAGLLVLVLFIPHLYWQYTHNWISFRYHLFESNVNPYKFSYTTDYLLGQLLLAGPIAGFILWPAAFLYKTKNSFQRALKFTAVGFFVFFLISTLKGKVEPNWTSPAIIPVMVLAHQYLLEKMAWKKWLIQLLPVTILIVIAFRVIMIVDIIPAEAIVERYHGWKAWPQQLKQKTGGVPVVFNNNYQRASKYWFYTGVPAYSLNEFGQRRSNYNFWPVEDSLLGKPVYIMDIYGIENYSDSIKTPLYTIGYRYDSSFHSFAKIQFRSKDYVIKQSDSLHLHFIPDVPLFYSRYLAAHPEVNEKTALVFFDGQKLVKVIELSVSMREMIASNAGPVSVLPALATGNYFIRIGIMSDGKFYTHNSEKIKLEIQ